MSKLGDWYVNCDICGKRIYASKSTKLSTYTGKGGCVVCRNDADCIDYGSVPFTPRKEQNITFVRTNHTNTDNAAPLIDLEDMTYQYYLTSSQDGALILSSQDDAYIISTTPI